MNADTTDRVDTTWGTLKPILLWFVIPAALVIWVVIPNMADAPRQRVRMLMEMASACPPIGGRIQEIVADGDVTRDEEEIIPTLLDQARAAPGGLRTCKRVD